MSEAAAAALAGRLLDESAFDLLVREDAEVYRPDGSLLLKFRKGVLPLDACRAAYPALRKAAAVTDNRGLAAGEFAGVEELQAGRPDRTIAVGTRTRTRYHPLVRGGRRLSRTSYAKAVRSGIVGFFDRNARIPYCRMTAFNLNYPDRFAAALPFIRAVDRVFAREVPDRYAAQRAVVARTSPDFLIHGTAFTTLTVNLNWQTAVHVDQGDLRAGFGVMSVLQGGHYDGGYLCFPRYRVAVDVRARDVLMSDVHEWHGNTPIRGRGRYERVSCIFYFRERMEFCGSAAEELEFAKRRPPGAEVLRADPRRKGPNP